MPSIFKKEYIEEDDAHESVERLLAHRVPWLFVGLIGGIFATLIVAQYEAILAADIRLSFFIPIVVYLSDAVGTQAETIYVRVLAGRAKPFRIYLLKEILVGLGLGSIFGLLLGIFAAYWLDSTAIGITIGLTTLINLTLAPVLAVLVPNILYKRHTDPALGAGPVGTIIQDLISLFVYFFIASIVVF